jgi:phosphoribosylformimino-5-aminoimidazole carboxamide ribotide isomerase
LSRVEELSGGAIDLTFGSALDIFGGGGVRYADCVEWNQKHERAPSGMKS